MQGIGGELHFIKNKNAIYYLAAQEKDYQQIQEFKNMIAAYLNDDFLSQTMIKDWKQLFSYLQNIWPKNKRIIIVIDEITYIIIEYSVVAMIKYFSKVYN